MIVELPWPPRALWPNSRCHWSAVARVKRSYKYSATILAIDARQPMPQARLRVHMAFCPPDKIRRDMDNLIAAMKAGLDGISSAIGVDDHLWVLSAEIGAVEKPGVVRITIEVAP